MYFISIRCTHMMYPCIYPTHKQNAKTTAVSILLLNNILFYDLNFFFLLSFFYSQIFVILFSSFFFYILVLFLKMSQLELPQIEILSTDLNWLMCFLCCCCFFFVVGILWLLIVYT